jgi:Family of unknown function (DUF5989)
MDDTPPSEFEKVASSQRGANILNEFWYFLRTNKKWWLLPILVFALLSGAMMLLSSTALAPFIYTMF